MKLSKETLKKYASAAASLDTDKDDSLGLAAKTLTLGLGPGIEASSKYITNKINDAVRQDNNIGEVFGEFSRGLLNKDGAHFSPVFKPSVPRAYGPLIEKEILPSWYPFVAHYPASMTYADSEEAAIKAKSLIVDEIAAQLKNELSGDAAATKLFGSSPEEVRKVLNELSNEDVAPYILKKFHIDKYPVLVETPRNNLYSMAHELGHVDDLNKMEGLFRKADKVIPGVKPLLYSSFDLFTGPSISFLTGRSQAASDWLMELGRTKPLLKESISATLGGTIPGYITGAIGASQTVRDAIRKLIPTQTTDDVMNFVEEHPAAVAASGFVPQLINEAYTSIPGYNITKKFYERLNDLDVDKLTPTLKAELGHYASRVGKYIPELEATKFLGHNVLSNLTYAMAPITAAAIAYLNRPKKEEANV